MVDEILLFLSGMQDLFTVEMVPAQQSKAFLKAYSPYLVPVLILGQQQEELAAIASAMGKKGQQECCARLCCLLLLHVLQCQEVPETKCMC